MSSLCGSLGMVSLIVAAMPPIHTLSVQQAPSVAASRPEVPPYATAAAPLVLHDITVIDVRDGRRLPSRTIVIVGNRIQALGRSGSIRLPKAARIVDARGKYVVPGFWDMELYPDGAPDPLMWLLIANGVTGYRNLSQVATTIGQRTTIDSMLTWRREIAAGSRVGPRILIGGPAIECPAALPHQLCPSTSEEARALVDSLDMVGADHLFDHRGAPNAENDSSEARRSRAMTFALMAEARRRRLPFVGHLPPWLAVTEASDSGMRAVDHAGGTEGFCLPPTKKRAETPTVARCAELAARLRRNGTWIVLGPLYDDGRPSRVTKADLLRRLRSVPRQFSLIDEVEQEAEKDLVSASQLPADYFTIMDEARLPILVGTDIGATSVDFGMVGFQLHDDLALLVEHGMRPLTALQAVTVNAAQYMGADSLGTVEVGKLADLILLDADPLFDIYNTQRIHAVIVNGRHFDRAALDTLLRHAGAAR